MPMTDRQLAVYLNILHWPNWEEAIKAFSAQRRATFDRMADLEKEIDLWAQGLGPKPKGVLVDSARTPSLAKGRVQRLRKKYEPEKR
jgi:hypothetical protein